MFKISPSPKMLIKFILKKFPSIQNVLTKYSKQAEDEVVPSSILVEVEVGVEVGVEVRVEVKVKVRAQNYFFGVGGWKNGE